MVGSGYALFLPNPRGSGGRGQNFARKVHRDMAGEDTHDYLAGIDSLVARGIVDPARIAVTGTSYGGFMSAWLVTQTDRFAAAVPISPVANWYSQHFATQIPAWDKAMLDGIATPARRPIFFSQPGILRRGSKRRRRLFSAEAETRILRPVRPLSFTARCWRRESRPRSPSIRRTVTVCADIPHTSIQRRELWTGASGM